MLHFLHTATDEASHSYRFGNVFRLSFAQFVSGMKKLFLYLSFVLIIEITAVFFPSAATMSARGGKKDNEEEYTPYDAENDSNALIVDGKKKKTKKVGLNISALSRLFSVIP